MQVLAQLRFFGLTFRCCTGCTMSYALHSNHAMGFRPHLSLRLVVTQAERLLRNQPLRGNDGGLLGYIHKQPFLRICILSWRVWKVVVSLSELLI